MKLYSNKTFIELLSADRVYLIRDRIIDITEVDEIPVDSILVPFDRSDGGAKLYTITESRQYIYKVIAVVSSLRPDILGIIDLESNENFRTNKLTLKITYELSSNPDDQKLDLKDITKYPGGLPYTIQSTLSDPVDVDTYSAVQGASFNNLYTNKDGILYELPFSFLDYSSPIRKVLPLINKGRNSYLYVETNSNSYLYDFIKQIVYTNDSTYYLESYSKVICSRILGLLYLISGVWKDSVTEEIIELNPSYSEIKSAHNQYDAINYLTYPTHILGVTQSQVQYYETQFNITEAVSSEILVGSMYIRFYQNQVLIYAGGSFKYYSTVDVNYLIACNDKSIVIKVGVNLIGVSIESGTLVESAIGLITIAGRKYAWLNNNLILIQS